MQVLLTILPIVLRFLRPRLKRQAAEYAANYLNQRRETRLTPEILPAPGEDIDPELLRQLCAQQAELEETQSQSGFVALLGGLAGAIIGVGLYFIYLNREQFRQTYSRDTIHNR